MKSILTFFAFLLGSYFFFKEEMYAQMLVFQLGFSLVGIAYILFQQIFFDKDVI